VIITSPHQHPRKDWLNIVKTTRARARIRQWFSHEEQQRVLELGREICERELRKHNLSLKRLAGTAQFTEILKAFSVDSQDNLLRRIGSGRITLHEIIKRLQPEITESELPSDTLTPSKPSQRGTRFGDGITIQGVNDLLIKISRCCMPVPGDEVMGFITMGRGISVHKVTCPNLLSSDPFRRVEVNWSAPANSVHRAQIQITAQNTKGVLAAITHAISIHDANIAAVEAHTQKDDTAIIRMVVEIGSIHHLRSILSSIRQIEGVLNVRRD
jgi:GTP pyrophosphokinase